MGRIEGLDRLVTDPHNADWSCIMVAPISNPSTPDPSKLKKLAHRYGVIARKRTGVGFQAKNETLYKAVAAALGTTWDGSKPHGRSLVARYVGTHKGEPMPKSKVQARKALVKEQAKASGKPAKAHPASKEFLDTYEWRALRMRVLTARGARCECCGATPKNGVMMHVDHIKPRAKYPHLALEESNLQILCEVCNHGKGNWDETDWRTDAPQPAPIVPVSVVEVVKADPMRPRLVRKAAV